MIGTSAFQYIFIKTTVLLLRAITPLSIGYVLARPFISLPAAVDVIGVWPIAEACFYFLVYLPLRSRIQQPATHLSLPSREEREILFKRCLQNTPDPEQSLSMWFRDAPVTEIKRENVKEFFRWCFLNTGDIDRRDDEELDSYVNRLGATLRTSLEPGRGNAECLRLTLEKVNVRHRPLLWYLIVFGMDNVTHICLLYQGFQYHRTPISLLPTSFPFRPQTFLTAHRSPVSHLSYWYRPHTSTTKLPIVFLHGTGIGYFPYVSFLAALKQRGYGEDGSDVGIIAIEILPVSARICQPLLSKEEFCRQFENIMIHHGFEKFVLLAHSFGSFLATQLMETPGVSECIESIVLVDPVSILLNLPDVAYNFTYRKPRRANEYQVWYFSGTDPLVAHTLARRFFWSQSISWKETFSLHRDRHVSIFLSGRDCIVNTEQVGRYLTNLHSPGDEEVNWKMDAKGWQGRIGDGDGLMKVFWFEELDHAQIFERGANMERLVDEICEISRARSGVADGVNGVTQSPVLLGGYRDNE